MAGAGMAIAEDSGGWEPGEGGWHTWPAAFLAVLAAHAAIAFLVLRSVDLSPDGGVALPQAAFDVSIHMQEMLGDQRGASEILTPGDATEMANLSTAPEALEPVETEAEQPVESEAPEAVRADQAEPVRSAMVSPSNAAEPLEEEAAESSRPSPLPAEAPAPADAPEPIRDAAERAAATDAAEGRSVPDVPPVENAPEVSVRPAEIAAANAPAAVSAEAAERLDPATAAQENVPELPSDRLAGEPAVAIEPVPAEPAAPSPIPAPAASTLEPATPAVTSLSGEVIETSDLAPLPRARPAAVPEEFLREYERQQREAEARRTAEREAAERRDAEQREAEERQAAARREQRQQERQQQQAAATQAAPAAAQDAGPSPPRRQQSGGGASSAGTTQRETGSGAADAASYQRRVFRHLQRYKRFPGGELGGGTATVRFTVNSAGAASGIRLVQSSGSAALDQATLDMVSRASPFPPVPPALGSRMTFAVPVSYSVR